MIKNKDSMISLSVIVEGLKKVMDDSHIPQGEYLTPAEAAIILKCTKRTVFNYCKRGWLDPRKVGKRVFYTRKSIMDILDGKWVKESNTQNCK